MKFLFSFTALFFIGVLRGQDSTRLNALDSLFNALEQNDKMMGTVSVFSNGKEIYQRLVGYRHITINGSLRPDTSTQYRIGSISKVFTATLILQLVEEGKLSLNTKLSAFYSQIYGADSITIGDMLSHHSGLPSYSTSSQLETLLKLRTTDAVIEKIAQEKGDWTDRQKGRYSNLNYMLQGFIIEKITGSTFEQQLQERICKKTGLKHTCNLQEYIDAGKNQSHSFRYAHGTWREETQEKWIFTDASGQMVSTAAELNVFMHALFEGRLVSAQSLESMKKVRDRFGLGLQQAPYGELEGYGHTGRIGGFVSSLVYFPSEKLGISLIINGQIYPMNDILVTMLDILHGQPYEMPLLKTIDPGNNIMQRYTGTYFSKETGYRVKIKVKPASLQVRMKKKGGLLNAVLIFYPLSETRFLNNEQGAIIDFTRGQPGFVMRIGGSKLSFVREG